MRISPIAAMAAMASLASAAAYEEPMGGSPRPGSARNRPSGSKPVAGGGAKERARRAARMAQSSTDNDLE